MDTLRFRLRIFLVTLIVVMLIGTVGFIMIEGFSFADAVYFSIVTITTVGYGDIHPATQSGKLLAIFLIIMGVGTFLGVIANATEIILKKGEKETRLNKLHILIGVFYSEIGIRLLQFFSTSDPDIEEIRKELIIRGELTEEQFFKISRCLREYNCKVDINRINLEDMRSFMTGKRDFLIGLLENPILLEHEDFTDILRAVFHLIEEFAYRGDILNLPETDRQHISGDIKRAYSLMITQWIGYIWYLKGNYPYLYSLSVRTNPFDQNSSPIVL
ncbi:MAG: potassium channel family protein [Nitrospirota bacterium]